MQILTDPLTSDHLQKAVNHRLRVIESRLPETDEERQQHLDMQELEL